MSDNIRVLVVGAGNMAREYCKVLKAQGYMPVVVGRGEESASTFEQEMGIPVLRGGIEKNASILTEKLQYAIVAVSVTELTQVTKFLLERDIKNILVEKPGALMLEEMEEIKALAKSKKAKVYIAYNRRFYSSTQKAMEMIEMDGGVTSFCFEFTEWGHVFRKMELTEIVAETVFLGNSTHVVDLAFFLGGFPREITSYIQGELDWHKRAAMYAGAGVSDKNALFSYHANWDAPGRWGIEIMTLKHRFYFRPLEKLAVQEMGSLEVNSVVLEDELDILFKPGLYKQVESFINEIDDGKKITISEQLEHMKWYMKMEHRI